MEDKKLYVVKFNNGLYWCGYNTADKQIRKAKINSMITNLPTDPFMLMSYINQQLRDNYPSLEELCKSLDIDENTLKANLKSVGFEYNPDANKFW